jgi:hypothetical protein
MIKSEAAIYQVLKELLRVAGANPQTCADLFDDLRVKALAPNANRVSDYLGHMWRRGRVQRWYASKDTAPRSRYAYTWLEQIAKAPEPVEHLTVVPKLKPVPKKPHVTVAKDDDDDDDDDDDGNITLDFKEFTITVKMIAAPSETR